MLTLICSAPFLQRGDQQRGQEQALCTQKGLHFPEFLNASLNLIQIMCGTDRNAPLLDSVRWSRSSHVYSGLLLGLSLILN